MFYAVQQIQFTNFSQEFDQYNKFSSSSYEIVEKSIHSLTQQPSIKAALLNEQVIFNQKIENLCLNLKQELIQSQKKRVGCFIEDYVDKYFGEYILNRDFSTTSFDKYMKGLKLFEFKGKGAFSYVQSYYDLKSDYVIVKYFDSQNKSQDNLTQKQKSQTNSINQEMAFMEIFNYRQLYEKNQMYKNYWVKFYASFIELNEDESIQFGIILEHGICSLDQLIQFLEKKKQNINEEQVFVFAYQLLEGLEYFQKQNFLLRDLKVENIILQEIFYNQYKIKFCDFNIATFENYELNQTSKNLSLYGTQYANSPQLQTLIPKQGLSEQQYSSILNLQQYSPIKNDVYSLGICLVLLMKIYTLQELQSIFENIIKHLIKLHKEKYQSIVEMAQKEYNNIFQDIFKKVKKKYPLFYKTKIIKRCLQFDEDKRANNFTELKNLLNQMEKQQLQSSIIFNDIQPFQIEFFYIKKNFIMMMNKNQQNLNLNKQQQFIFYLEKVIDQLLTNMEYEKAQFYTDKYWCKVQKCGNEQQKAKSYFFKATVLYRLKINMVEAEKLVQSALDLNQSNQSLDEYKQNFYKQSNFNLMGQILREQKNFDQSIHFFELAIQCQKKMDLDVYVLFVQINIASVILQKGLQEIKYQFQDKFPKIVQNKNISLALDQFYILFEKFKKFKERGEQSIQNQLPKRFLIQLGLICQYISMSLYWLTDCFQDCIEYIQMSINYLKEDFSDGSNEYIIYSQMFYACLLYNSKQEESGMEIIKDSIKFINSKLEQNTKIIKNQLKQIAQNAEDANMYFHCPKIMKILFDEILLQIQKYELSIISKADYFYKLKLKIINLQSNF